MNVIVVQQGAISIWWTIVSQFHVVNFVGTDTTFLIFLSYQATSYNGFPTSGYLKICKSVKHKRDALANGCTVVEILWAIRSTSLHELTTSAWQHAVPADPVTAAPIAYAGTAQKSCGWNLQGAIKPKPSETWRQASICTRLSLSSRRVILWGVQVQIPPCENCAPPDAYPTILYSERLREPRSRSRDVGSILTKFKNKVIVQREPASYLPCAMTTLHRKKLAFIRPRSG